LATNTLYSMVRKLTKVQRQGLCTADICHLHKVNAFYCRKANLTSW